MKKAKKNLEIEVWRNFNKFSNLQMSHLKCVAMLENLITHNEDFKSKFS